MADIVLEESSDIWTVTLNRPQAHNAFSEEMVTDLCKLLDRGERSSKLRIIIFRGEGKSFCAGGDIKAMRERSGMFAGDPGELRSRYEFGLQALAKKMKACSVPTIAKIEGNAIGAGLDFATMCDLRYATDNAKFASSFNRLHLVPGDGGTFFLPRVIGHAKATEMILTGRNYSAQEAIEMGLVTKVFPDSAALDIYMTAQIEEILKGSAMAQRLAKKILGQEHLSLEAHLALLASYQGVLQSEKEHLNRLKP